MLCRAHEPHPVGCKGHRQWKSQSHPWPLLRHSGCKAFKSSNAAVVLCLCCCACSGVA